MKHSLCPTLLVAFAALFAACHKDNDPQQWVEVTAESYSGAKVIVDGVAATWADGDELRVNGTTATVRRIDGHAYIEATAVSTTGVNRALYPASMSNTALGSDAATVSLPAQYRYRTDASGHQLLDIPMAARSDGEGPLHFRHLTGAMVFTISNQLDCELTLDHLKVQSNLYSLSGSRSIDFGNIAATAAATPAQDTDRTVMLIFNGQTLAAGESLRVTIPIAPVGSDNRFTVSVNGHHEGTRYTFRRAQTGDSDGTLLRNQLGYATTQMKKNDGNTKESPLFEFSTTNGKRNFVIKTPEDFALMTEAISKKWACPEPGYSYNAQNYFITADIDMQGYTLTPIFIYQGENFNGNGHTIRNLTIDGEDGKCGLFATVTKQITQGAVSPTIQGINMENITLNYNNYTGTEDLHIAPLICDIASNTGKVKINDCSIRSVSYNVTNCQTNAMYGGMVATIASNCTIQNCTVDVSATISQQDGIIYFGNLIAYITNTCTNAKISNCNVTNQNIEIQGTKRLEYGGFIARTYASSDIDNSKWTGDSIVLNTTGTINSGGLIGRIFAGSVSIHPKANTCNLIGTIYTNNQSTRYFGSFIGMYNYTVPPSNLENCTDNVTLNGEPLERVGG